VRWLPFVALWLAAGQAGAGPARTVPRDAPAASALWREVVDPHGTEVAALVSRARAAMKKRSDTADAGLADRRARLADHAYSLLRYARTLSPENTEVLSLLGEAADESGRTREAIDALETCARLLGPERADASADVTGRRSTSYLRLGTIYLQLGRLDDAIRWLRDAQGPIAVVNNAAIAVHLATALAARGDMADAIDVLGNALPPSATSYFTDAITLVSFALAVHYDRDEQGGAAFEILDRMQATLQQELGTFVERSFTDLRFAPAEDEYYYHALLYEAVGAYAEARAEWSLYAAVPDAPWRRRALDHIHALDVLRTVPAVSRESRHKLSVP